jgi:hypothetical protein
MFHDDKISVIPWDMHKGVGGRHFLVDIMAWKVLDAKY